MKILISLIFVYSLIGCAAPKNANNECYKVVVCESDTDTACRRTKIEFWGSCSVNKL